MQIRHVILKVADQDKALAFYALYDARYPAAILSTNNIAVEYRRLKKLGVKFRGSPRKTRSGRFVFFDDTCGNFIVLLEQK